MIGVTHAQEDRTPVPTRVRAEGYGAASGTPSPVELALDLDARGSGGPALQVTHGQPQALAALLLGTEAANVQLPWNAVLLVLPVVAVSGVYDAAGTFAVPFAIADPTLIGLDLHAQGLQYRAAGAGSPAVEIAQLTGGLRTTLRPGNPQPSLSYAGPALTATLIEKLDPRLDQRYEVLSTIAVPTTGWDLQLSSTQTANGVTAIYLVLEAPNPQEPVEPTTVPARLLVDLGFVTAPVIDVAIERRVRGLSGPPVFALAARIERDG
jgi:hypothetical protein